MNKRGMPISYIVSIILIIAGFLIVLFFMLYILDLKDFSSDEICRLSILTRATAPDIAERYAPIKCTTKKLCITNGEDCEQFIGETKNLADPVKLPVGKNNDGKSNAAVKIEETVANSMLDCWNIMGEGKLDLFGGNDMGALNLIDAKHLIPKETVCVICSRLAISDDVDPEVLKEVNVPDYMQKQKAPGKGGDTYLTALTDQQIRAYHKEFQENITTGNDTVSKTNEIAVLYMQINTEDTPWEAGSSTGFKSAAFVFTAGTKGLGPLGVFNLKTSSILAGATGLITGGIAAFQTYESRNIAASYCGEFTSTDQKRNGCSVLTTFDYNKVQDINQYCWVLEGYP